MTNVTDFILTVFFASFFPFSDYLLSFCIANGKECPQTKQINATFTQQVSYARQKLQRAKGKLDTCNSTGPSVPE